MGFKILNILAIFALFNKFFVLQTQQLQPQPMGASLGTRGMASATDIALNCATLGAFCQHNVYRAYMYRCCAATCGAAGQQACADRRGDMCPIWNARASFCQSQFYPDTFKADLCALTCSLCALRQQELQLGMNTGGTRGPIELNCQQLLQGAGGGGNIGEMVPPQAVQQPQVDFAGGTAAPAPPSMVPPPLPMPPMAQP
uniref:ShKT domain-containing protein n=1 Tax=Globodera rostochiensis TaxID=31243 RepID=A0A914I2I4_GLORO